MPSIGDRTGAKVPTPRPRDSSPPGFEPRRSHGTLGVVRAAHARPPSVPMPHAAASSSVLPVAPDARRRRARRAPGLAYLAAGVVGLGVLAGCGDAPPARPSAPAFRTAVRFEEAAEAAGVRFRMAFLPGEQGERFKINFYDHGCGVAVADVEGDGDDDLYFISATSSGRTRSS